MTAPRTDELAEREVDLARWRRAARRPLVDPDRRARRWARSSACSSRSAAARTYKAAALISLGQPVSPGGVVISGFGTNPRAVSLIVSSASAQAVAEQRRRARLGCAARQGLGRAGRNGDGRRRDARRAADLADRAGRAGQEDTGRGERARRACRRADDRAVRRHEDQRPTRRCSTRRTASSRRSASGSPR